MDPSNNTASDFATGIGTPVDLKVGPEGSLYYLDQGSGQVWKISAIATPTPTPTPITISGTISYCSNPVPGPVPGVTLTLTGSGIRLDFVRRLGQLPVFLPYSWRQLYCDAEQGRPGSRAMPALTPSMWSPCNGISSRSQLSQRDVREMAADVNGDSSVNTSDVIAIQRFALGLSTGIANTGKYQFTPASRSYSPLTSNQTGQNYDALVFGDVASGFVHRPEGGDGMGAGEVPGTVAEVALPEVAVDQLRMLSRGQSKGNFIAAVQTSAIRAKDRLVGFQGDFTFDERVITFQSEPVQKAGMTGGNWNVSGNILDGAGPIRILRVSAYSNDFTPLSGSGTLFELRMTMMSRAEETAQLIWAAPPDQFIFIDADLNTHQPISAVAGSIIPSMKGK